MKCARSGDTIESKEGTLKEEGRTNGQRWERIRADRKGSREFPYFTLVIAIRSRRIFSFVDRYIESFANWLRTIRSEGEREEAVPRLSDLIVRNVVGI